MGETLIERDGYRVRLVVDDSGEAPYDDGSFPIIRHTGWGKASQVEHATSYALHPQIIIAAALWWNEEDKLERYLRMFHGVTSLQWGAAGRGPAEYLAINPEHWRTEVGVAADAPAEMTEWMAFVEGDVYGYVIEREVEWQATDGSDRTMTTWEDETSCFGFYGYEYAVEAANEAFEDVLATV